MEAMSDSADRVCTRERGKREKERKEREGRKAARQFKFVSITPTELRVDGATQSRSHTTAHGVTGAYVVPPQPHQCTSHDSFISHILT
jgi:hypothetical protein